MCLLLLALNLDAPSFTTSFQKSTVPPIETATSPIEPNNNVIPNDGLDPALEMLTLSNLRQQCSRQSSLSQAPWSTQHLHLIATAHTTATLQPRLSCYLDNRRFLHDDPHPARLPHMTGRAFFEPINTDKAFATILEDEQVRNVKLHPSMGIVLSATWNSVNLYHLIADQLLGLAFTLKQWEDGVLLTLPREVLHLVNASWNKQWKKSDQSSCLQFSAAFSSQSRRDNSARGWEPSLLLNQTERGSDQSVSTLHCYCQSLIWYEDHSLPFANAKNNLHSPLRSLAMHEVKRLVQRLDDETIGSFVVPQPNCAAPRLLMVNRRKRSIGNPEAIAALAREVGFAVTVTDFDILTPREQYHAARGTDVFLSIHGMSLTYAVFMESAEAWSGCRTMIEMMHWVNPSYFFYYEDLAAIANVSRIRILPNDVAFGPSVVNKKKERALLKRNVFWWGLKGFDDQTAFYDLGQVKEALEKAMRSFSSCCRKRTV